MLTYNNAIQTFPGAVLAGPVRVHDPRVLRGRGRGATGGTEGRRSEGSRPDIVGRVGCAFSSELSRCSLGAALALPGAARADSFSLLRPTSPSTSRRTARSASASGSGRVLRRLPLRRTATSRCAEGESLVNPSVAETGSRVPQGDTTELEPGTPRNVRRRAPRRRRAHRLVLQRGRPDARVHDLVHAARASRSRTTTSSTSTSRSGATSGTSARAARRHRERRRGRSCAPGASRCGCAETSSSRARGRRSAGVDVPAHQFVELRTLIPRSAFTSTAGMRVAQGDGARPDRRRGAADATRYQRDHDRIDALKAHPLRTGLVVLALATIPALLVVARRLLVLRARAPHRLRPRVRAGAADRHGARARPDAAPTGRGRRVVRVHGDALRPDPTRGVQGRADDDRADDLGGPAHETVADLEISPGRNGELTRGSATSPTWSTASSTAGASGSPASATRSRTTARDEPRFTAFKRTWTTRSGARLVPSIGGASARRSAMSSSPSRAACSSISRVRRWRPVYPR